MNHAVVLNVGSSQGGHAVGTHADIVRTLPELLGDHARRLGDKVCFQDVFTRVTYRELERRTARLVGHLAGLGLARGERVAVLLGNRVEAVESLLAVTRASGVGVPLDPGNPDEELTRLLDDSGARVLITDYAGLARRPALPSRPGLTVVAVGGGDEGEAGDPSSCTGPEGPADEGGGTGGGPAAVAGGVLRYEELAGTEPSTCGPGRSRTGRSGLAALHLGLLRRGQGRPVHPAQPPGPGRGGPCRRPGPVRTGPRAVAVAPPPRDEPDRLFPRGDRGRGERGAAAPVLGRGGAGRTPGWGHLVHPARRRPDHVLGAARRGAGRGERRRSRRARAAGLRQCGRRGGARVPRVLRGDLRCPLPGALRQHGGGPGDHAGAGRGDIVRPGAARHPGPGRRRHRRPGHGGGRAVGQRARDHGPLPRQAGSHRGSTARRLVPHGGPGQDRRLRRTDDHRQGE